MPNISGRVNFISGATSFIGSHFLYSRAGQPETFIALLEDSAKEYLQRRLESCAASYRRQFKAEEWEDRIRVVRGDIADESSLLSLRQEDVNDFWHFAGTQDIDSTRRVLKLAHAIAAKRFIFLSSASAGSTGQAEQEVARFCEANNVDYRILRPAIVIGPSLTMKPAGCESRFYGLVRELYELEPTLSSADQLFSIINDPESPLDLIPVDHLTAEISSLIENNFAGGPIYQLTSTHKLTKDELYGYLTECLRELRCETEVDLFDRKWLQATDETSFCSYSSGDTNLPAVVLINAVGMPVLLLAPLARQLERQFRIVTWESRWAPSPEGVFDPQRCDLDHHLTDLTTLLELNAVDRAHVIGWCNGAQLALKFASSFPERTRSLVLLNGTFNLPETITRTVFEKNMRVLMPKIAGNIAFAQLYYRMTNEARLKSDESEIQEQSSNFITCRNPALRHLTNAPFRTPELLYRYANMVTRSFDEPEPPLAANLSMPVLVVSGNDDRVSHPDTSREIARRLNGAALVMLEGGDHHALHDDERIQNIVLDFLQCKSVANF